MNDALRYYNIAYTDEEIKEMIMNTCDTYVKETVLGAYNTSKHAGLPIRHPQVLKPSSNTVVPKAKVCLTRYFKNKDKNTQSVNHICFMVTGKEGISKADNFLYEIRKTTETSKLLASFVADCLENNLLQPSAKVCEDWEQKLDKRTCQISETIAKEYIHEQQSDSKL